jgi:hypothetical protein
MRRGEFVHATQDAEIARHVAVGEIPVQRRRIDDSRHGRIGHQRFELGCEAQRFLSMAVEERLLSGAIARQQQAPPRRVVQPDGELAIQAPEKIISIFAIGREQDLGVRFRSKGISSLLQFPLEISVIVNLPIEHDLHVPRAVDHRLTTSGGKIDDRQTPMAERRRAIRGEPAALVVGPAMHECITLGFDLSTIRGA